MNGSAFSPSSNSFATTPISQARALAIVLDGSG
jgi:hypothetical protein